MTLKVVSFNLWTDPVLRTERSKWVYTQILQEKPDIILFQQVCNNNVLELIKKFRKLNYKYTVSNNGRAAYELICSKWPILDHKFNRYSTSKKGRGLLWADLNVNGTIITVASTQLDQEANDIKKRVGQLDCILKFLANRRRTTIIGCDTGFLKDEGYDLRGTVWQDAWVSSGKNQLTQYTYDSNRNTNITESVQSRPDRIYYQGAFTELEYELLGTTGCCGTAQVNPSNHFGIRLTIKGAALL